MSLHGGCWSIFQLHTPAHCICEPMRGGWYLAPVCLCSSLKVSLHVSCYQNTFQILSTTRTWTENPPLWLGPQQTGLLVCVSMQLNTWNRHLKAKAEDARLPAGWEADQNRGLCRWRDWGRTTKLHLCISWNHCGCVALSLDLEEDVAILLPPFDWPWGNVLWILLYLVFIIYGYKIRARHYIWMWQFIFVINIRQRCSFAIIELIWLIYYHVICIFLSSTNNHLNIFGLDLKLKGIKMKCLERG